MRSDHLSRGRQCPSISEWCQAFTTLRVRPVRLFWLIAIAGVATCLLTNGCTASPAFAHRASADVMVTTLEHDDVTALTQVLDVQRAIHHGLMAAGAWSLPMDLEVLIAQIEERWQSRGRDLAALSRLKNVPPASGLSVAHHQWLIALQRPGEDQRRAVLRFHLLAHRELLRLLRAAGDHAADEDLRGLGIRQRAAVASTLKLLMQVAGAS